MRLPLLRVLLLWGLLPTLSVAAQDNGPLSGSVRDALDGTPLPGAAVFANGQGVLTDLDGQFTLSSQGTVALRVRYVGYVEWTDTLEAWPGGSWLVRIGSSDLCGRRGVQW